jgi:hypothetical protein
MEEKWNKIYNGVTEDRKVELLRCESGDLKVITTRKETEISPGYSDGNSHLMPFMTCEGDGLDIEAETPDQLEKELINDGGFSLNGAKEISNLAR